MGTHWLFWLADMLLVLRSHLPGCKSKLLSCPRYSVFQPAPPHIDQHRALAGSSHVDLGLL
jgi:hypothetical protein